MIRHTLIVMFLVTAGCDGADDGANADLGVAPESPDGSDAGDATEESADPAPLWDGDPLSLVDVFVGTGSDAFNVGNLFPGATTPFGMVRLSPDTLEADGSVFSVLHTAGYKYEDAWVKGFSHMRLAGAGIGDYGNILMRPAIGDYGAGAVSISRIPLDHAHETASPGYYRLESADTGIVSELTATPRTGVHRYTFPAGDEGMVVVDFLHAIGGGKVGPTAVTMTGTEISGMLHSTGDFSGRYGGYDLYFAIELSREPTGTLHIDTETGLSTTWIGDYLSAMLLIFDTSKDPVVELRVGLSFVDIDGARANLDAEAADSSFEEVRAKAETSWRDRLSAVRVAGGTDTRRRLLYTALYHSLGMPTLLSDVGGRYPGFDDEIHTTDNAWRFYTDLSLWDTYRTVHPLVQLLWPEDQANFLRSLVAMGEQGGALPRWPMGPGYGKSMVGSSADIVLGDAVVGGLAGTFDVDKALELAMVTAYGTRRRAPPLAAASTTTWRWDIARPRR